MIQSSLYKILLERDFELLVLKDHKEAQSAYELASFVNDRAVFLLPELRVSFGDDMRSFKEEFYQLGASLRSFYAHNGRKLLIAPVSTILHSLPSYELFLPFVLKVGDRVSKQDFIRYGYEAVDVVEVEGEISFRGDIIDVFVPTLQNPFRISLFDDTIEDIKSFCAQTQLCIGDELNSIDVYPALFALSSDEFDLLENEASDFECNSFVHDIYSLGFWLVKNRALLFRELECVVSANALCEAREIFSFSQKYDIDIKHLESAFILDKFDGYCDVVFVQNTLPSIIELNKNKKITLLSSNDSKFSAINADLSNISLVKSPNIVNIFTPNEIILSLNQPLKKKRQTKSRLVLDELNIDEYVVHSEYGIGIFRGLFQIVVAGSTRDFIKIDYQGEDKLLLPVENLNMIDRYIANQGGVPVVDRLGKGSFIKIRDGVKKKLFEIASSIIELAAKRDLVRGIKIDTSKPEIVDFMAKCGFELTPDQQKSIEEIFFDLSSSKVMDRLLSGDVGFGKTEVAMNAIFAVVKSGFQCAFIVPTTLLSSQHFSTLIKRFESFGVRIARLDRTVKNKTNTLKALESGDIDVVVGTHSILGVNFKNLALVVVDEEHKFGVKQKEKIKELSKNIHLLSMSATPIPRTLNMALSQIKSMSTLSTPPMEREGVRSFVKDSSPQIIKEAINRELRRSGKIFYIYNNISTIEKKKDELLDLLPNLKIAILHSKIDSTDSESIMEDFVGGKYDMLLSTSIVESGIDLREANTIIIDGANRFGMADLHQLRGRVGRGNKEGFCYFLVQDSSSLNENAIKRLLVLENNSYLGSGASLAYHDLEIRGGGNLLGEAQSGHIKNIGYAMYLRMLEDCINTLSGSNVDGGNNIDLKLSVSAYINPELVSSDRLRLDLYRRLSLCVDVSEIYEISGEIEDRFGRIDHYTKKFIDLILIKVLGIKAKLKTISNYAQNISITHLDGTKEMLKSSSKDDEDILECIILRLRELIS